MCKKVWKDIQKRRGGKEQKDRLFVQDAKRHKKSRDKTLENGNYSLTKSEQHDTMIIHTVILCLFLDFTSNMVILPQDRDDVKHQVE